MLYSEENVKANIRHKNGRRVFYLAHGDTLTPSARDLLLREQIPILTPDVAAPRQFHLEDGSLLSEKPETFTHLREDTLVPKTHPVIAFRGAVDTLQAQLLLTQASVHGEIRRGVGEILSLTQNLIRWDVLQEPAVLDTLLGLTDAQLRSHSQQPQKYYGIPHFMPSPADGEGMLRLNLARCAARQAELAASAAFSQDRTDIIRVLNRISSAIYILMIQLKKKETPHSSRRFL